MFAILRDPTFGRLFSAQVLSLIGTGLMTLALAILAYDLSGANAGMVVGIVFALKMVAYVGFAPLASALVQRMPTKALLVGLDLLRVLFVIFLPFVDQVWQIYVIAFCVQLCSAAFTPAFQSLIPEVLPDEQDYTRALSLSRLAYDLEAFLGPLLVGLLLTLISPNLLFFGTALGLAASAALVLSAKLPERPEQVEGDTFVRRVTRGFRIYGRTPRLRALFALSLAVSFSGAWVLVNSVVFAHEVLAGSEQTFTALLMAFGCGSVLVALGLPRVLEDLSPRLVMGSGGLLLGFAPMMVLAQPEFLGALAIWFVLGAATAMVLTPAGLLLRRSAQPADRPALFATQFSLSHAGWLVAYPLAGWLGIAVGLEVSFAIMAGGALLSALAAWRLWPAQDEAERYHVHPEHVHEHLHVHDEHHDHPHEGWEGPEPHSHPHRHTRHAHRHVFLIDDHHPLWSM